MHEEVCTQKRFLEDITSHKLTVLVDNGLYRHLRFRRPGTSCYGFDIITWPGHLCYTGDMGTFTFSRVEDMLTFFRSDKLAINPSYWSEKVLAESKFGRGVEKFSPYLFKKYVLEMVETWEHEQDVEDEDGKIHSYVNAKLRQAVQDEVLSCADDNEYVAMRAAIDFEWEDEIFFSDFWEVNCKDYTFHYIWCCYALVWGIRQYDQRQPEQRTDTPKEATSPKKMTWAERFVRWLHS